MSDPCATLTRVFEFANGVGSLVGDRPDVVLDIALSTNGYPGNTNPNQVGPQVEPRYIGYAWGPLRYLPAGWTEVHFNNINLEVYHPAQFTGQLQYSYAEVVGGGGTSASPESEAAWLNAVPMTMTIIGPSLSLNAGYSLSLQSTSLEGSCALQCSEGGNLLSGILDGVLVSISFAYIAPL
ncbi:hypothetical protein M3A49_21750 [Paraburkholderia sp. CNPSo 3076]|uniref:hypothetical protein n=1 Tax=Paraburkholderia sp. CNPSo 3076 TaxID=2940936 RepID=UPI00224D9C75|nr:hypothetical protein [Paraburkholderia sp. CNPSo 3076]MCX5542102.1 hypothetical protein [Paraburkholderia sp. CNPSo 3076]